MNHDMYIMWIIKNVVPIVPIITYKKHYIQFLNLFDHTKYFYRHLLNKNLRNLKYPYI